MRIDFFAVYIRKHNHSSGTFIFQETFRTKNENLNRFYQPRLTLTLI